MAGTTFIKHEKAIDNIGKQVKKQSNSDEPVWLFQKD